jgi:hypothetical protein
MMCLKKSIHDERLNNLSLLVGTGGEILVLLKYCSYNLFSAIWDCLYCIEALSVMSHILYPSQFVARIIENNYKNYRTLLCNL